MAALGADGRVVARAGDVDSPVFPRSANKPLQATGMLHHGLGLEGRSLALAAASHSGEEFHVRGVLDILAGAGLSPDALRCPPDLPLNERARQALLSAGGGPSPALMNCSGKHAAMLATCVRAGWPTDGYTDPGHPLQEGIRQTVERLAGERPAATGVDGCGAPLLALSLTGLARAFAALAAAPPGSPEQAVVGAMRDHPAWTSGTARPECALMRAVPGLALKSGAEGVEAFALPGGRAAAFKIDDGAARARPALTVALLRALGADRAPGVDRAALDRIAAVPVTGGGRVVGQIRITLAWGR